jgi:hypothetical protein
MVQRLLGQWSGNGPSIAPEALARLRSVGSSPNPFLDPAFGSVRSELGREALERTLGFYRWSGLRNPHPNRLPSADTLLEQQRAFVPPTPEAVAEARRLNWVDLYSFPTELLELVHLALMDPNVGYNAALLLRVASAAQSSVQVWMLQPASWVDQPMQQGPNGEPLISTAESLRQAQAAYDREQQSLRNANSRLTSIQFERQQLDV